ncbi:NACHT domain-containing protein [Lentzea sp. HUAS TT2]|uniref:NACHT domain-containing protein n=1 Tax=Lentzea sp. HUAS TT2 TaxID=3447454 RepID=UPI003F712326
MHWRPAQNTVLALSVVTAVLLALAGNLATNTVQNMPSWWRWAIWIVLVVVAGAALFLERMKAHRTAPVGPLLDAEKFLVAAVRREWVDEALLRGVFDPAPLPVRFHTTRRRDVGDHAASVLGDERLRPLRRARARLTGDVTGILAAFRSVPTRRLVVLGEAGSGKSVLAVLLTKALLEDRDPDEPVPVLLPLASWNPDDHLHTWLKRRLADDHPALTEKFGADVVERLVDEQRILPVLDGLDELEPDVRVEALRKINQALAEDKANIVITCRANEFEQAVKCLGNVVSGAAVVELEPVPRDTALAFLGSDAENGRWRLVADKISADEHGPLAHALGNPLMISLARAIYRPGTRSAEDPDTLVTATDPRADLLAGFIGGAYRADIPTAGPAKRRWSPASAQRWLSFLATEVAATDAKDFAWWQLRDRVPRTARIAFVALGCAAVMLPVFRIDLALVVTAVCALGVGLPRRGPEPMRLRIRFGLGRRRLESVVAGLGLGVVIGGVTRSIEGVLICGALGVVAGLLAGSVTYDEPDGAVTARSVLLADRAGSVRTGWLLAAAAGLAMWLASPDTPVLAVVSAVLVFFLRWLALVTAFVYIAGYQLARQIWLGFGTEVAVLVSLGIAGAVAALVWLMTSRPNALAMTAWTQWVLLTRVWYPLTGRLPWALPAFLADAHRRGVLQQVGSRYQFRHLALLDHLATTSERDHP